MEWIMSQVDIALLYGDFRHIYMWLDVPLKPFVGSENALSVLL